jgi:hypothetical protein
VPTKSEPPTISMSAARWLIFIGVCVTSIGIAVAAQLERDKRPPSVIRIGFVWNFLESTFVAAVLLGLLVTFIGSVTWAWRVPIRRVVWCGIEIVILAPIVYAFVPINVHGSLAVLMIVFPVAMLIGILFIIFAAARTFSPRHGGTSPG